MQPPDCSDHCIRVLMHDVLLQYDRGMGQPTKVQSWIYTDQLLSMLQWQISGHLLLLPFQICRAFNLNLTKISMNRMLMLSTTGCSLMRSYVQAG